MRVLWLALFLAFAAPAWADPFPGARWNAPDATGWSAPDLAAAQAFSDGLKISAVMVVHKGQVVAQWGDVEKPMQLASVRKSLLDALIGRAVERGQIRLDSTLAQLGIDDNPPALSDAEKQATVRMLLEARSGIYHPALYETKDMAARRPERFSHAPETFWYYNNCDFNALGTLYDHAVGRSLYDAFAEEIARPIGMEDYDAKAQAYVRGRSSLHPAYTFRMSTRDLARFALLYLNEGRWVTDQIVPAAWVRESTTPHSQGDHGFGYGYLWWTADTPPGTPPRANDLRLPPGTFFAWGAGGQFAFVYPKDDLVIVERTDRDLQLPHPRLKDVASLLEMIRKAGHLD